MKPHLKPYVPDLTVVMIDGINDSLVAFAIEETLSQISPKSCIIKCGRNLESFDDVAQTLWYQIPYEITTSHILTIQYDGFVLNGSLWSDEFLKYDYIGAPWLFHKDDLQVGNGGFSLRSIRLMRYLENNRQKYPVRHPEDDAICRIYRPSLEAIGFKFAPVEIASRFSFEREPKRPVFGFHGLFNVPKVLSRDRWSQFYKEAKNSPYITAKIEWKETLDVAFNQFVKRIEEFSYAHNR